MNKNKTLIGLVLDASGSMVPLQKTTIEAVNSFVANQLSQPGEVEFYVRTFDTKHNIIKNFVKLDNKNYVCSGGTALLDAIGFTVDEIGKDLASRSEKDRPGQVIIAVMTDGEENSSREYVGDRGKELINNKIKHQTDKYNWLFTFLGANQDAISTGASLGFAAANSMDWSASDGGVKGLAASFGNYATRARGGKYSGYSDDERNVAMDKKEEKSNVKP